MSLWGVLALCAAPIAAGAEKSFLGWEGMRTVRLDGMIGRMHIEDLDGNGRQQIILINTRKSRLELFRWLDKEKRKDHIDLDPDDPNVLPMALEFEREEIALDELPRDVVTADLDKDGKQEIIVLVSPPLKVLVYGRDDGGNWVQRAEYELLRGELEGVGRLMLIRGREKPQLMISFNDGIQLLDLVDNAKPKWMSPRETAKRIDWWLMDFDRDGDEDLVEWRSKQDAPIWWYQNIGDHLLPAESVGDQSVLAAKALSHPDKPGQMLILDANQVGVAKRYALRRGDESPGGDRQMLPLPDGATDIWCGIDLDGTAAVVFPDPKQPRLFVHTLTDTGWLAAEHYPIISNVKAVAAPAAKPGTLLLWAKDAADLHISRWENGRLTFPKPMVKSPDVDNRAILALGSVDRTVWWVKKVGDDLDLYYWPPTLEEPAKVRFEGVGKKAEKVAWLGRTKLMVVDQYARIPKLAVLGGGKLQVTQPARLKKIEVDAVRLFEIDGKLKLAHISDGVLQWLGDDLHPIDQVMLPDGMSLSHYVPLGGGKAWVLEQGGDRMHLLKPDDAGIPRLDQTVKLPGGVALRNDPVVGLILRSDDRLIKLDEGKPWELKLVESFDNRRGRPVGVKEPTVNRLFTTDITGDGCDEVILCDDKRHQLTVLSLGNDNLVPLISWKVFDDTTYPYGGFGDRGARGQPRLIEALDMDGDRVQDLAMICHDRLLIYLAREMDR